MKQNEHYINPVIKGLEHDNDSYRDRVRPKIENTGISLKKTFLPQLTLPSFDYHKKLTQ